MERKALSNQLLEIIMFSSKRLLISFALLSFVALNSVGAAEKFGADRHVARGVQCEMCHGPDKANPQYPDENTCVKCHPRAAMVEKTNKISPNPHSAPHNGDCTLCHMQHEPTVNYCEQCHKFNFPKVP